MKKRKIDHLEIPSVELLEKELKREETADVTEEFEEVADLSETDRGAGGFGSTGTN